MHIKSPLLCLLLAFFSSTTAFPLLSRDDPIELQELHTKALMLDQSCRVPDYETDVNQAITQATDMANASITTINWILSDYEDSNDQDKKLRVGMPLDTMLGIDITQRLSEFSTTKLQTLKGK